MGTWVSKEKTKDGHVRRTMDVLVAVLKNQDMLVPTCLSVLYLRHAHICVYKQFVLLSLRSSMCDISAYACMSCHVPPLSHSLLLFHLMTSLFMQAQRAQHL